MLNIDADREQTGWPHGVFCLEGWGVLLSTYTWNVHQDHGSPEHAVGPPQPWPPLWALSPSALLASSPGHDTLEMPSGLGYNPGHLGMAPGGFLGFCVLCAGMCAHVCVSVSVSVHACLCVYEFVCACMCVSVYPCVDMSG